jgi:hypothetical protein
MAVPGPGEAPDAVLEWSVDIEDAEGASVCGLAWCPGTGIIAAATRRRPASACADVALIEPHDPSRAARLQAPLTGARVGPRTWPGAAARPRQLGPGRPKAISGGGSSNGSSGSGARLIPLHALRQQLLLRTRARARTPNTSARAPGRTCRPLRRAGGPGVVTPRLPPPPARREPRRRPHPVGPAAAGPRACGPGRNRVRVVAGTPGPRWRRGRAGAGGGRAGRRHVAATGAAGGVGRRAHRAGAGLGGPYRPAALPRAAKLRWRSSSRGSRRYGMQPAHAGAHAPFRCKIFEMEPRD